MDDINQATEPMQLSEDSIEKSVGTANDKDGGDKSPLPELTPKGMDHIYQATEPMQFSGDSIEEAVGTDTNDEDGGDESSLPELTPKGTFLDISQAFPESLYELQQGLPMFCCNRGCTREVYQECMTCWKLICYEHFVAKDPCSCHDGKAWEDVTDFERERSDREQQDPEVSLNHADFERERRDREQQDPEVSLNHADFERERSDREQPDPEVSLNLDDAEQQKDEINETEQDQGDRDSLEHQEGQHTQHEDNMHEVQDSQSEKRGRKRKRNPEEWKKRQQSRKRNRGEEYVVRNKTIPARKIGKKCNTKCPHKCFSKFSDEDRKTLFEDYWKTGSYTRQRDFIHHHISRSKAIPRKKRKSQKRVRHMYKYHLPLTSQRERVCKHFFLSTLGIGSKLIEYTLKKYEGPFAREDRRGKLPSVNKTSEEDVKKVCEHIDSFPVVESHYCRASSKRKYLDPSLSVSKMYAMYESSVSKPVSFAVYRNIFNSQYNLGFHHPKKDECNTCASFNNSTPEEREVKEQNYKKHIAEKESAREEKQRDKERAKIDPIFSSFTFDLQQVLTTPYGQTSSFYYKRKMSTYNFTVYNQATACGNCFVWHETTAKRGACEIGSCLLKFMQSLDPDTTHISFFSDCCGGQNRNRIIACTLLYAVLHTNVAIIDHKFLISGHTQMECDAMHSCIERNKRGVTIHHPDQWIPVIQTARNRNRYEVTHMTKEDFLDLRQLTTPCVKYMKKDRAGNPVNWLKIRQIRVQRTDPSVIKIKYDFNEDFVEVRVSGSSRRNDMRLPLLYKQHLALSREKKQDLLSLCKDNIIPSMYHSYYENLTTEVQQSQSDESEEEENDGHMHQTSEQ
ncbi:uncharacterized protein [Diadema antillarum]|uniref:uncharacterized protein isoform X1 n=4 Tax=Diadema antillarum TaxID=105358 RepID=UPI003A8B4BD4